VDDWQSPGCAPLDTEITVKTATGCEFRAIWKFGLIGEDGKETGAWCATKNNDHPPCWTDGICWRVNDAGEPSDPVMWWKP
jgi:hypothetical protein